MQLLQGNGPGYDEHVKRRREFRDHAEVPRAVDPPQALAPMLATSTDVLPSGAGWAFEPKWDGYRALVRVRDGEATLRSRSGNDLTSRFPGVARAIARASDW